MVYTLNRKIKYVFECKLQIIIVIKNLICKIILIFFCRVTFWTITHISGNSTRSSFFHCFIIELSVMQILEEHRAIKGQSFKYVINQKQPKLLGGQVLMVQSPNC
jgi:hypothetical protein